MAAGREQRSRGPGRLVLPQSVLRSGAALVGEDEDLPFSAWPDAAEDNLLPRASGACRASPGGWPCLCFRPRVLRGSQRDGCHVVAVAAGGDVPDYPGRQLVQLDVG